MAAQSFPAPRAAPGPLAGRAAVRDPLDEADTLAGRWLGSVFYPASDGQPMADNSSQAEAMVTATRDLQTRFRAAFVTTDILVYYQPGVVEARVAPDVLVAFGVGRHHRSSYIVWDEGKPPDWVLEVASPSTVEKDLEEKRAIYEALKVPEYWLFDPRGGTLLGGPPPLQGLRLRHGKYQPIEPRLEGNLWLLRSEALRLDIRAEGKLLRFRDVASGEDLRHQEEEQQRAERAEYRAEREAAGRLAAERCAVAERQAAEAQITALEAKVRALESRHR